MANNDILMNAGTVIDVWDANADLKVGAGATEIKKADVEADVTGLRAFDDEISALEVQLKGLVRQRRDLKTALSAKITRIKSGIRATYGPDSSQYSQAGGVRSSERKTRARKATTPPST